MYQTASAEEQRVSVGTLVMAALGALLLLGMALFVSLFMPEWMNFLWLSVATVSLAAIAGWVIGHFLDVFFEDHA